MVNGVKRFEPLVVPRPEPNRTPMIVQIKKTALLQLLNNELERHIPPPIPNNEEITVTIPGGGEYSNMDLPLDNDRVVIEVRGTS